MWTHLVSQGSNNYPHSPGTHRAPYQLFLASADHELGELAVGESGSPCVVRSIPTVHLHQVLISNWN